MNILIITTILLVILAHTYCNIIFHKKLFNHRSEFSIGSHLGLLYIAEIIMIPTAISLVYNWKIAILTFVLLTFTENKLRKLELSNKRIISIHKIPAKLAISIYNNIVILLFILIIIKIFT